MGGTCRSMEEIRNEYNILIGKPEGKDHSEDLGVDGRIILDWMLGKQGGTCEIDASVLGWGPVVGCCEHDNEPSGSIKEGEFTE
jgi:hypothetical protein